MAVSTCPAATATAPTCAYSRALNRLSAVVSPPRRLTLIVAMCSVALAEGSVNSKSGSDGPSGLPDSKWKW
jgi:hypothetical protein